MSKKTTRDEARQVALDATDRLAKDARELLDMEPAEIGVQVFGDDRVRSITSRQARAPQKKSRRPTSRHALAKAVDSQLSQPDVDEGTLQLEAVFNVDDLLAPPYNPKMLCDHFANSNALRQNVDAYATNIEGFGHHFEPTFKLDSDDARVKVREAMYLDRLLAESIGDLAVTEPTDQEVEDKIAELRREMMLEKARLDSFFMFCCFDIPFITLRKRTRMDMEITGNGYWEVIRAASGAPANFVLMPSHSVRMVRKQTAPVVVNELIKRGPITFTPHPVQRRFRRFVQSVAGDKPVYFKEFGDPRVMSSASGRYYADVEALLKEEPQSTTANEVIHFVVHSPTSSYGVPRWIGNLLSLLGSRCSEEVNFTYFENKSIPPLIITVSGGRMSADTTQKIRSFIDNDIKGKRNFHKIMVLEAEAGGAAAAMGLENAGRCRIEVKPLTEAHLKDALFQEYDSRNMDKIGMSFRLPRLLRGDIRDFNRASAQASLEFAESQVFGPERDEIDYVFNRLILPALKVQYFEMHSHGPRITDPTEMATVIAQLTNVGALVPSDARSLAEERVFYTQLKKLIGDWQDQPIPLTSVGIPLDTETDHKIPNPGGDVSSSGAAAAVVAAARKRLTGEAKKMIKLRDLLSDAELEEAVTELRKAKKAERVKTVESDEAPETIRLTAAEMKTRFGIEIEPAA
jgi:PBSX family phage portal protein